MRRRGRPPTDDILTPREWQVLGLIREGLNNREIAERLGISLSGAKHHVSEILSKLDVSSREEAAAWRPRRVLSLAAPLTAWLRGWPAGRSGAVRTVTTGAAAVFTVWVLLVVLVPRDDRVRPAGEAGIATPSPVATPPAEEQVSSAGPYRLGYGRGGGAFVRLEGNLLTLLYSAGREVTYVIDEDTRFLWASRGAIRLDRSTDGLATGASVNVSFDTPVGSADVAVTPIDTVLIGYFKHIAGSVVAFGEGFVDIRLSPDLAALGSILRVTDGVVRVWVDANAEIEDGSYGASGLRMGLQASFGGLLNADREPVAYQMYLR